MRYKIGDILVTSTGIERVILNVSKDKYYLKIIKIKETYQANVGDLQDFSIKSVDRYCKLAYRRIKDTKLARKMYAGSILDESEGYLWVY